MAKFHPPQIIPSPIPEDRFAQNGDMPSSSAFRRAAWAYNHASLSQRKMVFSGSHYTQSTPAPSSTVETNYYFCFRTGHNVESVSAIIGMAPASAVSGTNQAACIFKVYDGSSTLTADPIYYPHVSAGTYTPSDVMWGEVSIDVDPDTVYVGQIEQDYYSRIHSVCVYEKARQVAVSTDDGVANPLLWETSRPIYDAGVQDLAQTGTKLWQGNATQLVSWSRHSVASPRTVTSTTYTNIVDGSSTAWGAASPGFQFDTQYHNTTNGDVPVELGVRATRTGGSGTLSVKIINSAGDVIEKTGIDQTASYTPCDTSTHTITAAPGEKYDIMARISFGSTWEIQAVGLWEYEA